MSKELEDLLRIFGLIAVFSLILCIALFRIRGLEKELEAYKNAPADTTKSEKRDTIYFIDPEVVAKYESDKEKVAIEVKKLKKQLAEALNLPPDTTLIHDTTTQLVFLPREYLVYKDSSYRAVVSGVQPRLDSMEVYQKTITQTITKYVSKPAPILKGYGGFGASKEIGGNDVLGRVVLGAEIKGKVSVQADYQRSFKGKKDYVGGTVILNF